MLQISRSRVRGTIRSSNWTTFSCVKNGIDYYCSQKRLTLHADDSVVKQKGESTAEAFNHL